MSNVLINLKDVSQTYGTGGAAVHVLKGADLTVSKGELVALVAPSGAGKSTLLHICGLLERPTGGAVTVVDQATEKLTDRQRTLLRRHRIGYVYQFHHLLPEFSAIENVMMPQFIAGANEDKAKARSIELLEIMGIAHRATHRPAELSGGEQQRVAIARAAANGPSLILADEPTGNLDPATSDKVFDALSALVKEHEAGCIIATHNHDLARKADRVVTIVDGKVTPAEL
ncbi:ABC transporter ATP-binding protein [Pelagibacterium lentulum]|uniref:Lipoprotein-releasing system ATP-binding protein LolD n=1 Tax=Pelagibacterium lentulum TaxID=2029865 RepID=A0A916RDV4_9HYPH|nr:ABC transporter ATP-binding protein [Pelagibacterium lentulum]GGA52300.1 lipoprotein-releasing system ATP-binding protein LolD [Pelagibacterium lentulum]